MQYPFDTVEIEPQLTMSLSINSLQFRLDIFGMINLAIG